MAKVLCFIGREASDNQSPFEGAWLHHTYIVRCAGGATGFSLVVGVKNGFCDDAGGGGGLGV